MSTSLIRLQSPTFDGKTGCDFKSNFKQAIQVKKNSKIGLKHLTLDFYDNIDLNTNVASNEDRSIKVRFSTKENAVENSETFNLEYTDLIIPAGNYSSKELLREIENTLNDNIPYIKQDSSSNEVLLLPNDDENIGFQYYCYLNDNNKIVLGRNYGSKKNANLEIISTDGSGTERIEVLENGQNHKCLSLATGKSFSANAFSYEYFTQGGGEISFKFANTTGNAYDIDAIVGLVRPMVASQEELEADDFYYGLMAVADSSNNRYEVKFIEGGVATSFDPQIFKTTTAEFKIIKNESFIEFHDTAAATTLVKSVNYVRKKAQVKGVQDVAIYVDDLYNVAIAFDRVNSEVNELRYNRDERLLVSDHDGIVKDNNEYYKYDNLRYNSNNDNVAVNNETIIYPERVEFSPFLRKLLGIRFKDMVLEQDAYNIESVYNITSVVYPDFLIVELENIGQFNNYTDSKITGTRKNILNIINKDDSNTFNFKYNVDMPLMMSIENRYEFLLTNLNIRLFDGRTNQLLKINGIVDLTLFLEDIEDV